MLAFVFSHLAPKPGRAIVIGGNVVVTIVDIGRDKVRLGIDAPSEIPVHRREVYEAIQRENRRASQLEPEDLGRLGRPTATHSDATPEG